MDSPPARALPPRSGAPIRAKWQPAGREIGYRTVDIFRVIEGELVEHWDLVDQLDMLLMTIGAVAPMPPVRHGT